LENESKIQIYKEHCQNEFQAARYNLVVNQRKEEVLSKSEHHSGQNLQQHTFKIIKKYKLHHATTEKAL
jgi:hypothetical protein